MQPSLMIYIAFIGTLYVTNSLAEIDPQFKAAILPHLVGAKLIGIFEDDHQDRPAEKYSKHAQASKNDTKWKSENARWLHRMKMRNKLHFCDEIIFEDDTIRVVPSSKPTCVLGTDDADRGAIRSRRKRDTNVQNSKDSHLPKRFTIPSDKILNGSHPQEVVKDDSYIKLELNVCSQPGGTVLIKDELTGKTLGGFRNGGTAYHCNQWLMDRPDKATISDSNQVSIEYQLPLGDDFEVSEVRYTFLTQSNRDGKRHIEYNTTHEGNNFKVFELDILYYPIEFIFEEPGKHNDGPEILEPYSDSPKDTPPLVYKPNWVKTYILKKRSMCDVLQELNCNEKHFVGIQVEILTLDLDFDRGDYLLIGPGDRPEFWKDSISQMISQKIDDDKDAGKHKIWINADSAFVRLVTHNSLISETDNLTALQFRWTPANSTLDGYELGGVSQMLKEASIQVCLEGQECLAFQTLQPEFVPELVHIFNRYLIDNEKSITTLINADSVQIFDTEPIFYSKGRITEQYCQFHLAISSPYDSEFPLVQSDVLSKMFFENSNSRQMINSKATFNNCIFQRISLRTILIPIAVILLLTIGIMGAFWKMHSMLIHRHKPVNIRKQQQESMEPLSGTANDDAMQY